MTGITKGTQWEQIGGPGRDIPTQEGALILPRLGACRLT